MYLQDYPVRMGLLFKIQITNAGLFNIKTMCNTPTTMEAASIDQKAFYIVPLQSVDDSSIKSYITASKLNDSTFSYRLYNKDSLSQITPVTDSARSQLMTSLAVFGAFEKSVNGKDSVDIHGAANVRFRNVDIKLGNDVKTVSNAIRADYMQEVGCEIEISIYLTYMYVNVSNSYSYGYVYEWQLVSVNIEIILTCWDYRGHEGGGGGEGGGEGGDEGDDPPYGGGGTTSEWWEYGSGWPWNNPLAYEMANQPWQPWWTGGGAGYRNPNLLSYDDLLILDNLKDEENQDESDASTDCYGTKNVPGSVMLQPNAAIAHLLIQEDYIKFAGTGGRAEYSIPNATMSGRRGRADLANIQTYEIFEIKPISLQAEGAAEAQWYVDKANQYCQPGPWRLGDTYQTPRILPNPVNPAQVIRVTLPQNGVLIYTFDPRATVPVPVAAPVSVFDAVKELMNRRRLNPNQDIRDLVMLYIKELKRVSPGTLTTLKQDITNIAYGIILAYAVEAVFTEGAALLADFEKVLMARYLLRIASII